MFRSSIVQAVRGASFVSALAVLASCDDTVDMPHPRGALNLRVAPSPYACTDPCPDPPRVLTNAEVLASAVYTGDPAAKAPTAHAMNAELADITSQRTSCTCERLGLEVPRDEPCPADTGKKKCTYALVIRTAGAGEAEIQLQSSTGAILDSLPLSVKSAVSLAPLIRGAGPEQTRPGRFLVYRGETFEVLPYPLAEDRQPLAHHNVVTKLATSDPGVVATSPGNGVEARALELGSATLTVSLGKIAATVEIDVVAR